MRKKKLRLILLLCCLTIAKIWAVGSKILIVELGTGAKNTFVLSQKPELTFANRTLQIAVNSKSTKFEIGNVKQFYFGDTSTDINALKADELKITQLSDEKVQIEGIGEKDNVRLYSVDGKQYADHVSISGNQAEVSLSKLPKGIYLINVSNKQTFKIQRK